ncbi:MAG: DUF2461 domain-containing protein [Chloroflexi bacterium]|nr:DUF2461 domain-containing protein [Chloroflexota bacterium]MBV9598619.1 DUF2461 domain-containing protein [Chloroflexota bacterium]
MATTARTSSRSSGESPPGKFAGFSEDMFQFLLELQAEQSRTWFKAHQDDYVRLCRRPLELLVSELQERLASVYPRIVNVEPHIFRIQRDTRFSKDKSPYKTNLAANMPIRPPGEGEDQHTTPGMYLSFGLDGEYVAIGAWHMEPPVVARYRSQVDDAKAGAQLQKIVTQMQREGWSLGSMEELKRVPPPYPQDHPRAELLKRKGLAASIQPADGISATPELVDWAEARLTQAAPMIRWLDHHL